MAALPSFVQLMASLGLEQKLTVLEPVPSPPGSPGVDFGNNGPSSPSRSKSSPSLRDISVSRNRVARYSPYSPSVSFTRRGSSSSVSSSSSSEFDLSPSRHSFSSASSLHVRRSRNKLSINVYGSASDLPANTPISTYVRRKTPGASPTSPTFSRDSCHGSPLTPPMPLSVPILPTLLPNSANSDSFPITPSSDAELQGMDRGSPDFLSKSLPDPSDSTPFSRHIRRHTGVRISTPPRSAELGDRFIRRRLEMP